MAIFAATSARGRPYLRRDSCATIAARPALGVYGGWFVGVGLLGVDDGTYWSQMQAKIDLEEDIYNGVIKSLVFGFVCTWIAIFQGYDCVPTSEGVSRATTKTVVHSALAVLGLDFVMTALMFGK